MYDMIAYEYMCFCHLRCIRYLCFDSWVSSIGIYVLCACFFCRLPAKPIEKPFGYGREMLNGLVGGATRGVLQGGSKRGGLQHAYPCGAFVVGTHSTRRQLAIFLDLPPPPNSRFSMADSDSISIPKLGSWTPLPLPHFLQDPLAIEAK